MNIITLDGASKEIKGHYVTETAVTRVSRRSCDTEPARLGRCREWEAGRSSGHSRKGNRKHRGLSTPRVGWVGRRTRTRRATGASVRAARSEHSNEVRSARGQSGTQGKVPEELWKSEMRGGAVQTPASRLCHFLGLRLWASYLTSPSRRFRLGKGDH